MNADSVEIRKFLESPAWKVINSWLATSEKTILEAIASNLLDLRWGEKDKWLCHYSGQLTSLRSLRKYLEGMAAKEDRQEKVKEYVNRFNPFKDSA